VSTKKIADAIRKQVRAEQKGKPKPVEPVAPTAKPIIIDKPVEEEQKAKEPEPPVRRIWP